jgi:hypothetical protein
LDLQRWAESLSNAQQLNFGLEGAGSLGRRALSARLATLVRSLDATLLDEPGIGPISAAKLFACDPSRFKHEAAFADATEPRRYQPSLARQSGTASAIHAIALIRAKHQPGDALLPRPLHQRRKDQA